MNHRKTTIGLALLLAGLLALGGCEGQGAATEQDAAEQPSATGESSADKPTSDKSTSNKSTSTTAGKKTARNWSEPQAIPEQPCANCGTISAIEPVAHKGEASGIGVVAGGIVGGIIGNQIGDGSGQTIATVAGAIGGALAGNEVEKYVNTEMYYAVTVDMDNGGRRTVKISNGENLAVGQKVMVKGSDLYLM